MERLRLLKRVIETGRRISDIAGLSDEALAHLAAEDTVSITSVPPQSARPSADNRTQGDLGACLAAVKDLNPPALETALVQASMSLGISVLFEEILTPLLSTIGVEWRDSDLRGIHERVASAQVRTFLGNLLHTSNPGHVGPMLLATIPTGQYCELGALMLAVTAASSGWDAIYLGADTPAGKMGSAHETAYIAR